MDLSIIIVNWNSKDYVRQCLASLFRRYPQADFEVIVVDGASFDGCDVMLAREFPSVVFVQSAANVGFGRANNLGARQTTRKNLLLLNPDTEIIEDSLPVLLSTLESLPDAGVVGCRLLNANRTLQTSCVQSYPTVLNQLLDSEYLRQLFPLSPLWGMRPLHGAGDAPVEAEVISGACMLMRRQRFEEVGGFTESFFMYGEDLDLCFKLRRAGYRNYHEPRTQLLHYGGASSRQAPSNFSTVMMRESVHRFFRLNRGPVSALAYRLSTAFSAMVRLALIAPLMLLGDRVVRHGSGSLRKWAAILRWSLHLDSGRAGRHAPPAGPSSPINPGPSNTPRICAE